jgi:AcrR family transcriptional regulator
LSTDEKPLRADARRNRTKVLAAAQEAFAQDGMSVPLDEIARRAGVGAGTVYRHFPSKEALFEAVVADRVHRLLIHARDLAGAPDPAAAFFDYLAMLAGEVAVKRDLADALSAPPQAVDQLREALETLLSNAQQAGAVRPDITVTELLALLKGTAIALVNAGPAITIDTVFAVIADGLRIRT